MPPPPGTPNFKSEPTSPKAPSTDGSTSGSRNARTIIDKQKTEILQAVFDVNMFPSKAIKERLEKVTGLPQRVISVWFQNKRSKYNKLRMKRKENSDVPPGNMSTVIKEEPMDESHEVSQSVEELKPQPPNESSGETGQ